MAEVTLTGAQQIVARLQRIAARVPNVVERALKEELEIERTESMRRTPVDTGALRASHRVTTESSGRDISGTIAVGGPAAPYAVEVHENLHALHTVGQAKFLESTIDEARPHLARRIATRIDLEAEARR